MKKLLFLLLVFCSLIAVGQGVGQGFTPSLGAAAGAVDSTRLVQDSILQHWLNGVVVRNDTVRVKSVGGGISESAASSIATEKAKYIVDSISKEIPIAYKKRHPYLYQVVDSIGLKPLSIMAVGASRVASRRTMNRLQGAILSRPGTYSGGEGYMAFGSPINVSVLNVMSTGGASLDNTGFASYSASKFALILDDDGDSYEIDTEARPDSSGNFTKITFWYLRQPGGGSFTFNLDGTDIETINTAGTEELVKYESTTLPDTEHSASWTRDAGGDVALIDYVLERPGTSMHHLGNGGLNVGNHLSNFAPEIYAYVKPSVVVFRMGINGSGINNPATTANQFVRLRDSILAYSPSTKFIVTGETDNGTENTQEEVEVYNSIVKGIVESAGMAFANLYELIPDWPAWEAAGLGDACCHENQAGARLIGDWYADYLFNATLDIAGGSDGPVGAPSKVAAFDATGALSSISYSNITENNIIFSDVSGSNLMGFSNEANPLIPRLSISNTNVGYPELIFGGQYVGGQIQSTITGSYIKRLLSDNSEIKFQFSENTVNLGSPASAYFTPLTIRNDEVLAGNFSTSKLNIGTAAFSLPDDIYVSNGGGASIFLRDPSSDVTRYAGIQLKTGSGDIFVRSGRKGGVTSNFSIGTNGTGIGGDILTYERVGNIGLLTDNPADAIHLAGTVRADGRLNMTSNRIINVGAATAGTDAMNQDATEALIAALIRRGSGSPEGAVSAPPGTLYLNNLGGAGTTLYVKETGTGNTGWVAK